ncbi:hypothetical protein [Accumulibacter sp.]|uniref:hypothetical protein n=1 Tax=Accumulibacter sp. TaxID=2053492 RepID=UPI002583235F|nr:hypothetical protein [Accumulibacter sp.]
MRGQWPPSHWSRASGKFNDAANGKSPDPPPTREQLDAQLEAAKKSLAKPTLALNMPGPDGASSVNKAIDEVNRQRFQELLEAKLARTSERGVSPELQHGRDDRGDAGGRER